MSKTRSELMAERLAKRDAKPGPISGGNLDNEREKLATRAKSVAKRAAKRAVTKEANRTAKKRAKKAAKKAGETPSKEVAKSSPHVWKVRQYSGRLRIFPEPNDLWEAASGYFKWADENPLREDRCTQFQGKRIDISVDKIRAMSISAMCHHLDISRDVWYDYTKRDAFADITKRIERRIFDQKIEGAAAGLLNATIIARDLGLTEKTDVTSGGEVITGITRKIVDA